MSHEAKSNKGKPEHNKREKINKKTQLNSLSLFSCTGTVEKKQCKHKAKHVLIIIQKGNLRLSKDASIH